MKYIFSPSKGMEFRNLKLNFDVQPFFPSKTDFLVEKLQKFSIYDIEKVFKIKNNLLEETYKTYHNFYSLEKNYAIALYHGVSFKQIELDNYSNEEFSFMNENIYILSALYGLLSPLSFIRPYRLDMTIKIPEVSLYKFWENEINSYLNLNLNDDEIIINLASNEFSKLIKSENLINIEFRQIKNQELKNISTEAKKARGIFLNYCIKNKISNIKDFENISVDGYSFSESHSDIKNLFFIKTL